MNTQRPQSSSTRRWLSIVGISALAILIGVQSSCDAAERPIERYATYAELETGADFGAAWFPTYIPKTATNITVARDMDLNVSWLKFHLQPEDMDEFAKGLSGSNSVELPGKPPDAGEWWPTELCHPNRYSSALGGRFVFVDEVEVSGKHGIDLHRRAFFALDAHSSFVYYWNLRY